MHAHALWLRAGVEVIAPGALLPRPGACRLSPGFPSVCLLAQWPTRHSSEELGAQAHEPGEAPRLGCGRRSCPLAGRQGGQRTLHIFSTFLAAQGPAVKQSPCSSVEVTFWSPGPLGLECIPALAAVTASSCRRLAPAWSPAQGGPGAPVGVSQPEIRAHQARGPRLGARHQASLQGPLGDLAPRSPSKGPGW